VSDNYKKKFYIYGGPGLVCIMEQTGTTKDFYYIHSDYLGSIEYVTGQNGSLEQELSYDPWGRLRNPVDWSYSSIPSPKFDRGFTTHEHLEEFDLINMNGRVYDPLLGIFLSPDPYVQAPDYSQNFNRYGYGLNNPMKYTDPTGEWFITAFATIGGAYFGGLQANNFKMNPLDWDLRSFNTYYSIVTGGISGYGLGSSLEDRYNDMIEYRELIKYQEMFSSEDNVLLASNNGVGLSELQKLNKGLRQSMYTKAKYDVEYEFANDAYKNEWRGVPYKYKRNGREWVVDEESLFSELGYNLAKDIDINQEIIGYIEGGYHVFYPKNFEPIIYSFKSNLIINSSGSGLPTGPGIRFYGAGGNREIALILFKTWNAVESFNMENYSYFKTKVYNQLIKGYGISPIHLIK